MIFFVHKEIQKFSTSTTYKKEWTCCNFLYSYRNSIIKKGPPYYQGKRVNFFEKKLSKQVTRIELGWFMKLANGVRIKRVDQFNFLNRARVKVLLFRVPKCQSDPPTRGPTWSNTTHPQLFWSSVHFQLGYSVLTEKLIYR